MIDTPRVSSVLALVLLSWGVLEGCNLLLAAISLGGTVELLLKCVAIAVLGVVAGFALSRWALDEWTTTAALPFVIVGPWIAAVHLVNHVAGPLFSLTTELIVMAVGSFAVHGVIAGLERDDIGTPPSR